MSRTSVREIWDKLYSLDLDGMLETGYDGNSYLSWADAWALFVTRYPNSFYEFHPETHYPNGTVMVNCTVRVHLSDDMTHEDYVERTMWLPVMESGRAKKSLVNPTSRQIQDCRMRCLVKCLGMYGLGIKLWRKSDGGIDDSVPGQLSEQDDQEFTFLTKEQLEGEIEQATSKKQILDLLNAHNYVAESLDPEAKASFKVWVSGHTQKFVQQQGVNNATAENSVPSE